MRIGVPKETAAGEHRVALVPEVVGKLKAKGLDVLVQAGAGADALLTDAAFAAAGAQIDRRRRRDLALRRGRDDRAARSRGRSAVSGPGSILIGFLAPLTSPQTTRALADAKATAFAMEAIPRISRAQSMDALSSQSNVAGYKAALLGAEEMGRFYPMLMTAAGTIPPAKVLVLGVGVAGLQALATAKRLGARTTGYDVRPEVAEQVAVARRAVARPRPRGQRRGRLRARADRGGARAPAAGADRRDQGLRRRHHDRARARAPGAEARHRRGRRRHEAGLGDRRPRRRGRRQLRADRAGRDGRAPRRQDRLAAEPAGEHGRALLAAVRAQRARAARAVRRRGRRAARSTSRTRSSPAPASCATARSSTPGAKAATEAGGSDPREHAHHQPRDPRARRASSASS